MLPGPVILSTLGTLSVPNASAAIAPAPPMRKMRSTPATSAAATISARILPPREGGVAMTISFTPATFAGIAFMSTVLG